MAISVLLIVELSSSIYQPIFSMVFMCNTKVRKWRILCWNVRGLNSDSHQRALRSKIEESQCSVLCVQETKCETIDHKFLRKFCPKRFDFLPFHPLWVLQEGF
jgi:hypothetical protein